MLGIMFHMKSGSDQWSDSDMSFRFFVIWLEYESDEVNQLGILLVRSTRSRLRFKISRCAVLKDEGRCRFAQSAQTTLPIFCPVVSTRRS